MGMLIYINKLILSKYNKLVKSYIHLLTLHFLAFEKKHLKAGGSDAIHITPQTSHHQHCCNGGWCPGHRPWPCDHTTSTSCGSCGGLGERWCNEMYILISRFYGVITVHIWIYVSCITSLKSNDSSLGKENYVEILRLQEASNPKFNPKPSCP